MKAVGVIVVIAGAFYLAITLYPVYIGCLIVLSGLALVAGAGGHPGIVSALMLLGGIGAVIGQLPQHDSRSSSDLVTIEPGQYSARSSDLAGLISVRCVVREGQTGQSRLIFAEAHAPPFMGVDQQTLRRETIRALEQQRVPLTPDKYSHVETARLLYGALHRAFEGDREPIPPEIPPGAWIEDGGSDSYWGMFPEEYDHRCDFSGVSDGVYKGKSTNPVHPGTVSVTVVDGKLVDVKVMDIRVSSYGKKALTTVPQRMIEQNETHVDIVSGATRTSYILRSAVYNACMNAKNSEL